VVRIRPVLWPACRSATPPTDIHGAFTAEMYAIHFVCELIESKPIGAYIILSDSYASIEGLHDMQFERVTCNSYQKVSEISRGIWIRYNRDVDPSHVGIQGNERAAQHSPTALLFVSPAGIHRLLRQNEKRMADP
jgi:hypothetical protein